MMNYEIFKEVVKEKFMDYMPDKFKGMELVAEPVEKVNVTLDGIILREEGRNISPTIYINDMYKKYQDCGDLEETLMAACDFMERAYEQAPVVDVDSIMKDANEKIVFQLINTEQNKTFLEQVPHREFQDLSIVYKVIISADKDAVQSSKITNEFAKRLGMSEEQLFKCAAENTRRLFPPVVRSMNDIMREMFARDGMPQEIAEMMIAEIPPEQTMWVISNEKGINGAGIARVVFQRAGTKFRYVTLVVLQDRAHGGCVAVCRCGNDRERQQIFRLPNGIHHLLFPPNTV